MENISKSVYKICPNASDSKVRCQSNGEVIQGVWGPSLLIGEGIEHTGPVQVLGASRLI